MFPPRLYKRKRRPQSTWFLSESLASNLSARTRSLFGQLNTRTVRMSTINGTITFGLRKILSCIDDVMIGQLHQAIDIAIVRYEYIVSEEVKRDSKIAYICFSLC